MGKLQEEYVAIAEGMRNGTLKPLVPQSRPELWIDKRFTNSYKGGNGCARTGLAIGFGEQFDAAIKSSIAHSFGSCSRNDAKLVYISREISSSKDVTPAPVSLILQACCLCHWV